MKRSFWKLVSIAGVVLLSAALKHLTDPKAIACSERRLQQLREVGAL